MIQSNCRTTLWVHLFPRNTLIYTQGHIHNMTYYRKIYINSVLMFFRVLFFRTRILLEMRLYKHDIGTQDRTTFYINIFIWMKFGKIENKLSFFTAKCNTVVRTWGRNRIKTRLTQRGREIKRVEKSNLDWLWKTERQGSLY